MTAIIAIAVLATRNPVLKIFLDTLAICLLAGSVGFSMLNGLRKKRGESKPQRALWKQFDDTHHWDSTAEEWVPNDGQ
jgi:hypothetical protein